MQPYYQDASVTLYHGDCLHVDAWLAADVLVTDPPYGMAFVSGQSSVKRPIAGDQNADARDAALALWGPVRAALVFGTWRVPRPAHVRQVVTWIKPSAGPGMGDLAMPWGNATEEVYVLGEGWHGRRRPNWIVTTDQQSGAAGLAAEWGHPTPKPERLMERLLECAPAGVIADPFAGVGSTLLAARTWGRKAVGVEIEERYCETIAKRLSQGVLFGGVA